MQHIHQQSITAGKMPANRKGSSMNIVKKLIIAAAIPAFAVAAVAQAPAQKAPAAKPAPAKNEAAKPAPAKNEAAKPAPPKTLDQILSFLPEVLAEGKGVKITKQTFIKELSTQIPASALAQVPADQLKPIVKQMVNGMIDRELVFSIAQKNGYKPSAQLVKNEFDSMVKQLPQDKLQMLESQLKLQKKTIDSYKNEIANDPMAQKGAAFSKYLKEKIEPQCNISDADIEKFYRENQKNFQVPEEITASHILIRPQVPAGKEKDAAAVAKDDAEALAKIKAIQAKLKQGADFGALAEKESACPSGKSAKGSLGKFKRGMMVPEFDKAAFALKKGEMSDIVKTQFGYHIIKLTDRTAAGYEPLAKVKGDIKNYLKAKKTEEILKAQIEKTRKELGIKINNF